VRIGGPSGVQSRISGSESSLSNGKALWNRGQQSGILLLSRGDSRRLTVTRLTVTNDEPRTE